MLFVRHVVTLSFVPRRNPHDSVPCVMRWYRGTKILSTWTGKACLRSLFQLRHESYEPLLLFLQGPGSQLVAEQKPRRLASPSRANDLRFTYLYRTAMVHPGRMYCILPDQHRADLMQRLGRISRALNNDTLELFGELYRHHPDPMRPTPLDE